MVILRQEHQQTPCDADLRGQPSPLAANRIFDDLHGKRLTFKHLALNRDLHLRAARQA